MSIRTRVLTCLLAAIAAGFCYLVDWVVDDIRPRYLESMEESLVDTAHILAAMIEEGAASHGIDRDLLKSAFEKVRSARISARIFDLDKTTINTRVYVTDAAGIVLFDSEGKDEGRDFSRWNDVYLTLRGKYGARATRADPDDASTATLYVAAPLTIGGRIAGVVTVSKPVVSASLFIDSARRKIIAAATWAGLAVAALGIITSVWITRPIKKLTAYAQAVRDGKRVSLPALGRSEIGVMGKALEEMREALEGKEYVENYVQTLTHELKGPLSAIRGAAELMQEEMPREQRERFLRNVQTETARIQKIVDRLLFLSSLEKRRGLRDVDDVDLAELLREVAESLAPCLAAKRITLSIEGANAVRLRGERFLLRHAVANLLQNAVDFAPAGSGIEMSARALEGAVEVEVADRGPGIPSYALDRVFEPFYSLQRPGSGEKSSGLGLTFVRTVAELHGGSAAIENREGGGARATLRLAVLPPSSSPS